TWPLASRFHPSWVRPRRAARRGSLSHQWRDPRTARHHAARALLSLRPPTDPDFRSAVSFARARVRSELADCCGFMGGSGARQAERRPEPERERARRPVRGGSALELLPTIDEPRALRELTRAQLAQVVRELREHLIALGSEVGGHFAGSLGAVELTVALHAVFDTPHDRIVWDVGHQTYGHKALTGRLAALHRIKKADGPAGFLRRSESPYDVFGAGHAGTSVSAALGIAEAAARTGVRRRAVAVIGDGAATAGMSFEALNHAGQLRAALRVVFNDNG